MKPVIVSYAFISKLRGISKKDVKEKISTLQRTCDLKKLGLIKGEEIDQGKYGIVSEVCYVDTKKCVLALKEQDFDEKNIDNFFKEIQILLKLRNFESVPSPYLIFTCETKGFILMDKINGTVAYELPHSLLEKEIDNILYALGMVCIHMFTKYHIVHFDLHSNNWFYNPATKKITIIDFGFASEIDKNGLMMDKTNFFYPPFKDFKFDEYFDFLNALIRWSFSINNIHQILLLVVEIFPKIIFSNSFCQIINSL